MRRKTRVTMWVCGVGVCGPVRGGAVGVLTGGSEVPRIGLKRVFLLPRAASHDTETDCDRFTSHPYRIPDSQSREISQLLWHDRRTATRTLRRRQSHYRSATDAPTVPTAPLDHCPAIPEPPGAASERPGAPRDRDSTAAARSRSSKQRKRARGRLAAAR